MILIHLTFKNNFNLMWYCNEEHYSSLLHLDGVLEGIGIRKINYFFYSIESDSVTATSFISDSSLFNL